MKKAKLMMAALFAVGMMLGMAGMASAAAISCGGCHGDTSKTPAYESHGLPMDADNCTNDARGLHGVHGNYSSASYTMSTYGSRGSCSYCHTSSGGGHPTATHNNNYVNITGNLVAGKQNFDTRGLDYNDVTSTCTNSCHKNEGASAKWGNYTMISAGIELTCNSCHDDSSAASIDLSGAHSAHLGTAITVTGLGASDNTDCDACHPDNTSDMWSAGKADDGSVKAYPHASDGTNVATDNAELDAGISATRNAGATDTCAAACHSNASSDQWGATSLTCTSCHSDVNGTGTALGGAHTAHFDSTIGGMTGITCSNCHAVPGAGDTSHATALPPVSDNAAVVAGVSFNDGANTCAAACHTNATDDVWTTGTLKCTSCHYYANNSGSGPITGANPTGPNNEAATVPLGGSHSGHFNAGRTCDTCHSVPSSGDTSHASTFPIAADNAAITGINGGTWDDANNRCTNTGTGCHGTGPSYVEWGATLSCNSCHAYPDGYRNWTTTGNGHTVQYDTSTGVVNTHIAVDAGFYNVSTDTYNAVTADASKCGKCHYGLTESSNHHTGAGSVIDVVPSGNYNCGAGDFTANVNATGSNVTCSSVSCHSGKTTPNWW